MPFREENNLRFFEFESLAGFHVVQGIFTRHGGISPRPWASLNLGGLNGDSRENVIENRRRIFDVARRPVNTIFDVWQVHSADVVCTNKPRPLDAPHQKADAIVTNRPSVTLFMRFADCVPIFFHDPEKRVVAIAHAGWQGTVKNIAAKTVETMVFKFGCRPDSIIAGIGPSIGPDHYEVGDEVVHAIQELLGNRAHDVVTNKNGRTKLDLWGTNQILLEQAGVAKIEVAGICTACHMDDWYSHRGERGNTGRFGALLALEPEI